MSDKQSIDNFELEHSRPKERLSCFHTSRGKIMVVACLSILTLAAIITVPSVVLTAKSSESDQRDELGPLRIGAFNIKNFGKSKVCNHKLARTIASILQRYDIVLILEVVDVSQISLDNMLDILRTRDESWKFVSSDRIGRTRYKEQYLFYYKSSSLTVEGKHQVSDPEDVYEREPFAIKIKYTSASRGKKRSLALAGIHTKPSDTLAELKELPTAIETISNSFTHIDGVIMMGDYNADCSYLSKKQQNALPIFSSGEYHNLINHTMDTTVAKGDCAYDRITVYGSQIDVRHPQVYRFDEDLNLNTTETAAISDHYPVEFLLY